MRSLARLALAASTVLLAVTAHAAHAQLTISQIYGGGGNGGAQYTNDFVELFNSGASAVSLTGYSLQYSSAAGNFGSANTALAGSVAAGRYFLIQLAGGGVNGAALPAADGLSTINISATAGKLLLASTTTPFTTGCPIATSITNIVDFVGYGTTANCFEGVAAPPPSNATSLIRNGNGASDTNNNFNDFVTGTPSPRNSAFVPTAITTPEPASLVLVAGGLAGVVAAARRRRAA